MSSSTDLQLQLRPPAALPPRAAEQVLAALDERDVSAGGLWNAGPGMWQRYDVAWDGPAGMRGSAELVGSVAIMHGRPHRGEVAVYKASITTRGRALGWTPERLCDEALAFAGLSLASCPREGDDASAVSVPEQRSAREILRTNLSELRKTDLKNLLTADVRELLRPPA